MKVVSRRVTAPLLIALFALALAVPAVFAHADLVESDPVDGGSIALPYTLVFRYSEEEELDPTQSSVLVRDAAGNVVGEGGVSIGEDGEPEDLFTMVVGLADLPLGTYQAHWIAITSDGGKTQGDVNFTVIAATAPPSETPLITLPGSPAPTTPAPAQSATPTPSEVVTTPAPTPINPTPPAQPTGAELILPLVLVGAVGVALVWLLLRRRSS